MRVQPGAGSCFTETARGKGADFRRADSRVGNVTGRTNRLFPRSHTFHRLTRHALPPCHLLAKERQEGKKIQSRCAFYPLPEERGFTALLINNAGAKMTQNNMYDWTPGINPVGSISLPGGCTRQEELVPSPDGERFAAVVIRDDNTCTLRVNDTLWDLAAEKILSVRFAPDGRLSAVVRLDGKWAFVTDGTVSEERFDALWGPLVSKDNSRLALAFQKNGQYGVMLESETWNNRYHAITDFAISDNGAHTCAVVRTASRSQSDPERFNHGLHTVAVDGIAWNESFLNAWSPAFDATGQNVACTVRMTPHEYGIAVNGQPWSQTFSCAWDPCFDENTGSCIAPVRTGGKWGMAQDGAMRWEATLASCGTPLVRGGKVWATVARKHGECTVSCDGSMWDCSFPVLTDLVVSPDGTRAAALASHNNTRFRIVADGNLWENEYDMAWPPVFSPDGEHIAVHVRKNGKEAIVLDGELKLVNLDQTWNLLFSPDSKRLLYCFAKGETFFRHVINLAI